MPCSSTSHLSKSNFPLNFKLTLNWFVQVKPPILQCELLVLLLIDLWKRDKLQGVYYTHIPSKVEPEDSVIGFQNAGHFFGVLEWKTVEGEVDVHEVAGGGEDFLKDGEEVFSFGWCVDWFLTQQIP